MDQPKSNKPATGTGADAVRAPAKGLLRRNELAVIDGLFAKGSEPE